MAHVHCTSCNINIPSLTFFFLPGAGRDLGRDKNCLLAQSRPRSVPPICLPRVNRIVLTHVDFIYDYL